MSFYGKIDNGEELPYLVFRKDLEKFQQAARLRQMQGKLWGKAKWKCLGLNN